MSQPQVPAAPPGAAVGSEVPWRPLEALAAFLVASGVTLLLVAAVSAIAITVAAPPRLINAALIPLTPLSFAAVTLALVRRRHPDALRRLWGRRPARLRDVRTGLWVGLGGYVVFGFGLGALAQAIVAATGRELPVLQEAFVEAAAEPATAVLLVLSAVVLAPVGEELFYRGLLYQGLRARWGSAPAMWVSAAVFAVTHVNLAGPALAGVLLVVVILPLGVLLAWSFERTGSLIVPIVAHALFNAVQVLLLLLAPAAL